MTDSTALKRALARLLLEKAYREGDFVLASGRRSDYYFDCRPVALHPEGAWLIGALFLEMLENDDIQGVAGMTLGADPLIASVAVLSRGTVRPLAGIIVRKEPKGHGTGQYLEGLPNFSPGDRVAMLEDVVTTGGTLLKAIQRVEDAGLTVSGVCCVLDREEGGRERLAEAGYDLKAVFTRRSLVDAGRA